MENCKIKLSEIEGVIGEITEKAIRKIIAEEISEEKHKQMVLGGLEEVRKNYGM